MHVLYAADITSRQHFWNNILAHSKVIFMFLELGCISTNELCHEISNNVVCAPSKASDQPAHTRSLIRACASG